MLITFICIGCKREITRKKHPRDKSKFCSHICYLNNNKENIRQLGLKNRRFTKAEMKERDLASGRRSYRKHVKTRLMYYRQLSCKRRGADGNFTIQEWNELKEKQNFCCKLCGKSEIESKLTIDHIIPISKWNEWAETYKPNYRCGDIQNIQALCKKCNCIKSNHVLV
jgi:5-methylcytosine-specific restriction endonuclease McrA